MSRRRLRRPLLLLALGIFLLQLGWTAAVPAFGGIDEFDHVYRAASVARGHWAPKPVETSHGRGELIRVPADLVEAAHNRCAMLGYTLRDNCQPASSPDAHGDVLVASAAARYNPIFYALVGTVARPFHGADALYVMRFATILLSDLFLLGALWVCLARSRSGWPLAALLVALTPTALYATTVAGPNGVQLAAALLMWCAGLAIVGDSEDAPSPSLLWMFVAASCTVVTVHTTGPMWVAATGLVLVSLPGGWRAVKRLGHQTPRHLIAATLVTGLVTSLAVAWTLLRKANLGGVADHGDYGTARVADVLVAAPLWVFQSIGTIPFRNQPITPAAMALAFAVFAALVVGGLRRGSARDRAAIVGIVVIANAVPALLTVMTFDDLGLAWQGRYTLPFSFGLPLLAGWIIDRRGPGRPRSARLPVYVVASFGVVELLAMVFVRHAQDIDWPGAHTLPPLPLALFVAVAAGAAVAVVVGARLSRSALAEADVVEVEHATPVAGRSPA